MAPESRAWPVFFQLLSPELHFFTDSWSRGWGVAEEVLLSHRPSGSQPRVGQGSGQLSGQWTGQRGSTYGGWGGLVLTLHFWRRFLRNMAL